MAHAPMGPFCQSCGMPLTRPEDFGSTADGLRQNDYCSFCFDDGRFLQPDITIDQMIEFVMRPMIQSTGMTDVAARAVAEEMLPYLGRWSRAA